MNDFNLVQAIQLLANIGVLAGIVFLAYELRQNTQATKMSSAESLLSNSLALDLRVAQDADTAELLVKASSGKQLSDVEQFRVSRWVYAGLHVWENVHYLYYTSTLDKKFWPPFRNNITQIARNHPIMVTHWRANAECFTQEFNMEMEAIVHSAGQAEDTGSEDAA